MMLNILILIAGGDDTLFYENFGCNKDEIKEFRISQDDYSTDKLDTTLGLFAHHEFNYLDKTQDVIFATIIGTYGNHEWASNFDVGAYDDHYTDLSTIKTDHPDWENIITTRVLMLPQIEYIEIIYYLILSNTVKVIIQLSF